MPNYLKPYAQNSGEGAYKGYLIKTNPLTGDWMISKDGQHISYATSAGHAKSIIDGLVN